jgi:hypothetical protein
MSDSVVQGVLWEFLPSGSTFESGRKFKRVGCSKWWRNSVGAAAVDSLWGSASCSPVSSNRKPWSIAGACPPGSKLYTFQKLRYLVVPAVVDLICCNICKIYEFIEIVTGRKASCSIVAWWIFISVYFKTTWRRVQVFICMRNSRDRTCYSGNTVFLYGRPTGIVF